MCKLIKNVYFCNSLITVLIKIMINRVLIRLKIIQIVYAYYQNGSKNLDSAEKELFFSLSKAYDLYNYLLMLMIALTDYAQKRIDTAKAKLKPTKEELYPNTKFVENKFIAQLEVNKQLTEFVANQKRTWANDQDFVRLILGNGYVDMTLDNIANGEPMAVYNGSSEVPMFLGITLNNVMVSFNCFAMGLLTSFGTGYMLLSNGIMVGAFQTFFYQHDLLWESSLAIWLHGTLEIWAIIVAGAAGLALGNGWLFPGTYSRLESFRRGAKRGLKIVIGTVPVFIMAGFIEGFITRHTELPDMLRLGVILTSLAFILFYYIYLPNRKKHGITET